MTNATLDGFVRIDEITSIYRPADLSNATGSLPAGPSLIVLCSWMGAAPKHIAKYSDGYRRLFPKASILLLEANLVNTFFGSNVAATCEIADTFVDGSAILHAFSNGGANNAVSLANRASIMSKPLLFDRVILDSCPGQPEVSSATRAITLSLPNRYLIRTIGPSLLYPLLILWMLVDRLLGLEDFISCLRRELNDGRLFSLDVPRLYLYSEGDALVNYQHVHDHAEEARLKGYTTVREEKFLKAPHCALLNESSLRYWDAVKAHIMENNDDD